MISNIIVRIFGGLGVGGLLTLIVTWLMFDGMEMVPARMLALNLFGSMLIGAYFSVSALLFEIEDWSMLKQTVVHYMASLVALFPVFTWLTGWIPLQPQALLIGWLFFTGTYLLNWIGWYSYFKHLEKRMNQSLRKRN
ncbi:DUF3021 domain-containing protein [Chryseomicrobium excrementi]|uniref:DUF3021 domain-containing protein n=1 Tax=Chryseomicrobium excrementi TaxID=2041346 RepID=UPI0013FE351C|nr:DUF3021 domain-containing protein [Chryseomicrobium excrementi]